jgi:hypothetical protein
LWSYSFPTTDCLTLRLYNIDPLDEPVIALRYKKHWIKRVLGEKGTIIVATRNSSEDEDGLLIVPDKFTKLGTGAEHL